MRLGVRNDASRRGGPTAYRTDAVDTSRPAPRALAEFYAASENAGTFRGEDTNIGVAAAATAVHAEPYAVGSRFGSPAGEETE
jgi:hypothetical protein